MRVENETLKSDFIFLTKSKILCLNARGMLKNCEGNAKNWTFCFLKVKCYLSITKLHNRKEIILCCVLQIVMHY